MTIGEMLLILGAWCLSGLLLRRIGHWLDRHVRRQQDTLIVLHNKKALLLFIEQKATPSDGDSSTWLVTEADAAEIDAMAVRLGMRPEATTDGRYTYVPDVQVDDDPPKVDF